MRTALPTTMIMAMASPMARPIPRTMEAAIPEREAGSNTLHMVCQWVAPSARAPSLWLLGTALMLSSLMLTMVGSIMAVRTMTPAAMLKPGPPIWRIRGTMSTMPTRP
jgi:hypothetical protein